MVIVNLNKGENFMKKCLKILVAFFISMSVSGYVLAQQNNIDSIAIQYNKADEYYKSGDIHQARAVYEQIIKMYPEEAKAYYKLGSLQLIFEEEGYIENMKKAVELEPDNFQYNEMLAMSYFAAKDKENTIPALEKVKEMALKERPLMVEELDKRIDEAKNF